MAALIAQTCLDEGAVQRLCGFVHSPEVELRRAAVFAIKNLLYLVWAHWKRGRLGARKGEGRGGVIEMDMCLVRAILLMANCRVHDSGPGPQGAY